MIRTARKLSFTFPVANLIHATYTHLKTKGISCGPTNTSFLLTSKPSNIPMINLEQTKQFNYPFEQQFQFSNVQSTSLSQTKSSPFEILSLDSLTEELLSPSTILSEVEIDSTAISDNNFLQLDQIQ